METIGQAKLTLRALHTLTAKSSYPGSGRNIAKQEQNLTQPAFEQMSVHLKLIKKEAEKLDKVPYTDMSKIGPARRDL